MIKNVRFLLFAILFLGAASLGTLAQESVAPQLAEPMLALPASDMVVTIDMRRIMDEAIPSLLTNAPQARARFNTELDKIRTKSGFDVRSIDRVVVGMGDFSLNMGNASAQTGANNQKMPGKFVAIATGSFNAPVLVAAARLVAGGKYREENYAQSTLYTFTLDKSTAPEAFSAVPAPEISIASVDAHTIIIGLPASVRATIDLRSGAGGQNAANAELISLANSVSGALIGVGADVKSFTKQPLAIVKSSQKLEINAMDTVGGSKEESNPSSGTENEFTKALEAVRQVFFSIGMADRAFNVHVVARTEQSAQAQDLANMLEALRGFAESEKDPKVRRMLDAVKVISQNDELQIMGNFAQTDIASLITDKGLKFGPAAASRTPRSARRAGSSNRARRRRQ